MMAHWLMLHLQPNAMLFADVDPPHWASLEALKVAAILQGDDIPRPHAWDLCTEGLFRVPRTKANNLMHVWYNKHFSSFFNVRIWMEGNPLSETVKQSWISVVSGFRNEWWKCFFCIRLMRLHGARPSGFCLFQRNNEQHCLKIWFAQMQDSVASLATRLVDCSLGDEKIVQDTSLRFKVHGMNYPEILQPGTMSDDEWEKVMNTGEWSHR